MFAKTHLAITLLAILLFISQLNYQLIFVISALIATLLPDIDSAFSLLGSFKGLRFFQFFVRHRSFLHSLTLCILLSVILTFVFPIASFGFFLGYSLHLLADSFTIEGIQPFWPLKKQSSWRIKTGSAIETSIFVTFVIIDVIVLFLLLTK